MIQMGVQFLSLSLTHTHQLPHSLSPLPLFFYIYLRYGVSFASASLHSELLKNFYHFYFESSCMT